MDGDREQKIGQMLLIHQHMAMNSLAGPASFLQGGMNSPSTGGVGVHSHRFASLAGNQISKALLPTTGKHPNNNLPFNYKLTSANFPCMAPLLLQSDDECGEFISCELEDREAFGFMIGGEERLCVPPILHTILKNIELEVIDSAFDSLQIHCTRCSDRQLKRLKEEKVLPTEVHSAGLIRKTDAERLCTNLLHGRPGKITDVDQRSYPEVSRLCVPVYHECFGEGHGFLFTNLYTHDHAACISCADCEKLFSPDRFITHTHFNQENKICHWGFNRRNWRSYLLLSDDEVSDELKLVLEDAFQRTMDKFRNVRKRKVCYTCGNFFSL